MKLAEEVKVAKVESGKPCPKGEMAKQKFDASRARTITPSTTNK
jgi:hypothetical protein